MKSIAERFGIYKASCIEIPSVVMTIIFLLVVLSGPQPRLRFLLLPFVWWFSTQPIRSPYDAELAKGSKVFTLLFRAQQSKGYLAYRLAFTLFFGIGAVAGFIWSE